MEHTKGNWRTSKAFDEVTISREGVLEGSKCICKVNDFGKTKEERIANAKLIAAAPEMLEALEDAKKQIEHLRNKLTVRIYEFTTPTTTECIELIDKAIKKATE